MRLAARARCFRAARRVPATVTTQHPRERLFTFRLGFAQFRCELLDCGERGVEAEFFRNDAFLYSHRFTPRDRDDLQPRDVAIAWAESERHALEHDGTSKVVASYVANSRREGALDPLLVDRPPRHPGEILLDQFLKPLKLSEADAARRLKMSFPRLHAIVECRRHVTADMAVRLSELFAEPPQFWLRLQAAWDIWHAVQQRHARGQLGSIARVAKRP